MTIKTKTIQNDTQNTEPSQFFLKPVGPLPQSLPLALESPCRLFPRLIQGSGSSEVLSSVQEPGFFRPRPSRLTPPPPANLAPTTPDPPRPAPPGLRRSVDFSHFLCQCVTSKAPGGVYYASSGCCARSTGDDPAALTRL